MSTGKLLLGAIALGGWMVYNHTVNDVKVKEYSAPPPKYHHVVTQEEEMPKGYTPYIESTADEIPKVENDPNVVHWSMAFQKSLLSDSSSSTSSAEKSILSGDANLNGQSGDTGSTDVTSTSTTTSTSSKPSWKPGQTVPSGYHAVKGYTTKTGHIVKPHLVKNPSRASQIAKGIATTVGVSHSHDTSQRAVISRQNFPSQTISKSDPTIIIGTH
jgi:hypothetical protein